MDEGERITGGFLNEVVDYLFQKDKVLLVRALEQYKSKYARLGIEFGIENQRIVVRRSNPIEKDVVVNLILDISQGFEAKYGVNEFGAGFKLLTLRHISSLGDRIKNSGIEFPITSFKMTYSLCPNISALNAVNYRSLKWNQGSLTITTERLMLRSGDEQRSVMYIDMGSIGREIYMMQSEVVNKGVIRTIDYGSEHFAMPSILLVANEELMDEFLPVVRAARSEYRRLTNSEAHTLYSLYQGVPLEAMDKASGVSQQESGRAFKRLLSLGYISEKGSLTSNGVNILSDLARKT